MREVWFDRSAAHVSFSRLATTKGEPMRHHFRADDAGPDLPDSDPSPLTDKVLALLEEAGCPVEVNDQVVKLIERWEYSLLPEPTEPDYGSASEEPSLFD